MNNMSLIAKMVNQIPKAKMEKPTVYLTNLWSRKIFSIVEKSELSKCLAPQKKGLALGRACSDVGVLLHQLLLPDLRL